MVLILTRKGEQGVCDACFRGYDFICGSLNQRRPLGESQRGCFDRVSNYNMLDEKHPRARKNLFHDESRECHFWIKFCLKKKRRIERENTTALWPPAKLLFLHSNFSVRLTD